MDNIVVAMGVGIKGWSSFGVCVLVYLICICFIYCWLTLSTYVWRWSCTRYQSFIKFL